MCAIRDRVGSTIIRERNALRVRTGTGNATVFVSLQPGGGAHEHTARGGQRERIPTSDVLIERGGGFEHVVHDRDPGGIPGADGLVERGGAIEHVPHVRDLRGIPRADGLVERGGAIEHVPLSLIHI